ncbi:hypothetical protein CTA2_514, partial [Colletotrichum tanaceti]
MSLAYSPPPALPRHGPPSHLSRFRVEVGGVAMETNKSWPGLGWAGPSKAALEGWWNRQISNQHGGNYQRDLSFITSVASSPRLFILFGVPEDSRRPSLLTRTRLLIFSTQGRSQERENTMLLRLLYFCLSLALVTFPFALADEHAKCYCVLDGVSNKSLSEKACDIYRTTMEIFEKDSPETVQTRMMWHV